MFFFHGPSSNNNNDTKWTHSSRKFWIGNWDALGCCVIWFFFDFVRLFTCVRYLWWLYSLLPSLSIKQHKLFMETPEKKEFPFNRMHRVRRYHGSTEVVTYFSQEFRAHNVQQCHWKIIYKMKGQNISSNGLIPQSTHSHKYSYTHTQTQLKWMKEMNRNIKWYSFLVLRSVSFVVALWQLLDVIYNCSICILFHFNNKSIDEMRANISAATAFRHIKFKRNRLRHGWRNTTILMLQRSECNHTYNVINGIHQYYWDKLMCPMSNRREVARNYRCIAHNRNHNNNKLNP